MDRQGIDGQTKIKRQRQKDRHTHGESERNRKRKEKQGIDKKDKDREKAYLANFVDVHGSACITHAHEGAVVGPSVRLLQNKTKTKLQHVFGLELVESDTILAYVDRRMRDLVSKNTASAHTTMTSS